MPLNEIVSELSEKETQGKVILACNFVAGISLA